MKKIEEDWERNCKIVHLDDGGISYNMKNSNGEISLIKYSVFQGIDIIYNDIHIFQSIFNTVSKDANKITINHCRDGRLEWCVGNESGYLAPGDISIHRVRNNIYEEKFPTGHYHGITIQIDLDKSPHSLACFLEDVDVEPTAIASKLHLNENAFFVLRQLPAVEHIFSELYTLPDSIKKGYFKVKVLELLLFLSAVEMEEKQLEQRGFSEVRANLAKNVCSYLEEHLEKHITIAELAEKFGVSTTQIKTSFTGVYGTSVYSYIRKQRMHAAAKLLLHTDRTVLDIAGRFGYENGGKFAKAFRTVMGVSPTQYRNRLYRTNKT